MNNPHVGQHFEATPGTHVIPTYWPVPGMGTLAMNAFLIESLEPVLVDTGVGILSDDFLDALSDLIDPAQLRWIWLTHEDRDHTGSLMRLLELAPRATIIGTFLAFGRAAPDAPLPLERQRIVNPGDWVNVGDRNLRAFRPPLFDSPGTLGLLDDRSGALFSSDCFGAPLPDEIASARDVDHLAPEDLSAAQVTWATADSPWVTLAAEDRLHGEVENIRGLQPTMLLSSHLPPVHSRLADSFGALLKARTADPMPGPTQQELESLLAGLAPSGPA